MSPLSLLALAQVVSRLVIAAGLSDDEIDRLIDQARSEVQPHSG